MKKITVICSIFLLGLLSGPLHAQVFFVAELDGSQSVPSVSTAATGTAWAVLSADSKTLTYRVTYANLSSSFTASHFHLGAISTNGAVVEPITFTGNTAQGEWTNIPDSIVSALMTGKIYINIHSNNYPGGEIRGQLKVSAGQGFSMSLDGSQDVPPLSVAGTGTGWGFLSPDTDAIIYHITVAGLSSNLTASHFHFAAAGSNGGVIFPISFVDSTSSGTWYIPDTLTSALIFNLLYINVHTSNNPGGEIRGQFTLQPSSTLFLKASLDGEQSNPPDTSDATATAWAILNLNENGGMVTGPPQLNYRITYANLTSPFVASHFHYGSSETNGPVVEPITFAGNSAQGTWTNIADSMAADMVRGQVYINIHSTNFPAGEIRGQLKPAHGIPFSISLDGSQDVPPISTTGTGTGWAMLDSTGSNLSYQVTLAGLSSNLIADHFHLGAAGTNGGVVEPINSTDSTTLGTWTSLPDTLIPDLLKQLIYVNFHTTNHPGGEIRGQLTQSTAIVTRINEKPDANPKSFELAQNYPNPFNPSTAINFTLPHVSFITLDVFNILGEKVVTLVNTMEQPGSYSVKFDGSRLASGVYFYRLTANGEKIQVRKMILLK